ncbi:hypothetical protein [Solirhodobacter olei]|uniref:hypothetical protein n=1 Tax=Solirhodobacter olei TaxID=2493082 RepID=UPI0019D424EB|nr:hypothetical protein [Solirhodobacter olei]
MLTSAAVLVTALALAGILLWPRLRGSSLWRATITPLASIIGSGFLVLGPLLDASYGRFAPVAMALLCAAAWAFGAAIRYSMATGVETDTARPPAELALARLSDWALAFAYVISVCYYLNLFGAFATRLTPWHGTLAAHLVTSAVYAVILSVGWTRGFKLLERIEYGSVTVNLSIIGGLLAGLVLFFAGKVTAGALQSLAPTLSGWHALSVGFGLIVIVQGFETSRYLGAEYPEPVRERSMRWAQIVSALVYLSYIALLAYSFPKGEVKLSETAILGMMAHVTPILPVILVAGALAAQFSAAVADTGGGGGLIAELTHRRLTERVGYGLLAGFGLCLTWVADVFHIIAYASRAFAAYYTLQAAVASLRAARRRRAGLAFAFAALAVLGGVAVIFGEPAAA